MKGMMIDMDTRGTSAANMTPNAPAIDTAEEMRPARVSMTLFPFTLRLNVATQQYTKITATHPPKSGIVSSLKSLSSLRPEK